MRKIIFICFIALSLYGKAQDAPDQGIFLSVQDSSVSHSNRFSIGLEVGLSANYLITNISNLSFTRYESRNGYMLAVPLQYALNEWFAVFSDPGVIQKNYDVSRSGFFEGIHELHTNTYINLPLMGRFLFGGKNLKGFLDLGVYGAYWVAGRVSGSEPNILDPGTNFYDSSNPNGVFDVINRYDFNQQYDFNSTRDRRFEFGGILGIGMRYEFDSGLQLFAEAKKLQAFTDQQKSYMTNQLPRYNSTYSYSVGVMMNLNFLSRTGSNYEK